MARPPKFDGCFLTGDFLTAGCDAGFDFFLFPPPFPPPPLGPTRVGTNFDIVFPDVM